MDGSFEIRKYREADKDGVVALWKEALHTTRRIAIQQ